eukprot:gene17732-36332_t
MVLLDNMTMAHLVQAVAINAGRAILEVSGGVSLDTVRAIAATGVDRISIGARTKDVKATDFSIDVIDVEYEQPACSTKHAWARVPVEPTPSQRVALKDKIKRLLKEKNAVMVSHYYVHPDLQDLAEETGGLVSDSLEMARFGRDHSAQTLVVSGVKFMGETSKILSPHKTVLMPDLDATCSLDLGCPISEFSAFCDAHPDRTVVVYANTSAAVKARADWLVTSSCALDIVRALKDKGQKILWAPDKHLGGYIQRETGADMVFWEGACIVHDEFKAFELEALIKEHPKAKVLVHPESPQDVVALAHAVGSTSAILKAAREMDATEFIVATDNGMMHKLRTPGQQGHAHKT